MLLSITANAGRQYGYNQASGGQVITFSAATAVDLACAAALQNAGYAGGVRKVGGSTDWHQIAFDAGLTTTLNYGDTATFICQRYDGATVTTTALGAVRVIQSCPANGTMATAIMRTTIATYDVTVYPVSTSTDVMPNPQCSNSCVIEHPTGTQTAICDGYVAAGVTPAVGVAEWVVCGFSVGFVFTGASCNYTGANYSGMALTATDMPASYDSTNPAGATTSAVNTSETCVDADANGYDDDSRVACSVLAAAQLDALTSAKKQQMSDVGTGATMSGDVNALAGQNGGIFAWPQALLNFLNPPSTCEFQFVLNALPMLAAMNVTAGWCTYKAALEPFLAFGMWVITIFVSAGFFQRVS